MKQPFNKSLKWPSLSVVIPTMGRETLLDTLQSIARQQIEPGDEVIVVSDGSQPVAKAILDRFKVRCPGVLGVRHLIHGPTRDFGNSQRNFAYQWAHGQYIAHVDDDDIYTEDAFIKIRKAIIQSEGGVQVFKVKAPWGEIVWTTEDEIEQGNCCTIQMVIPNHRDVLPKWNNRQGGNIPFLKDLKTQFRVSWRKEIIAVCRPQAEDRWF